MNDSDVNHAKSKGDVEDAQYVKVGYNEEDMDGWSEYDEAEDSGNHKSEKADADKQRAITQSSEEPRLQAANIDQNNNSSTGMEAQTNHQQANSQAQNVSKKRSINQLNFNATTDLGGKDNKKFKLPLPDNLVCINNSSANQGSNIGINSLYQQFHQPKPETKQGDNELNTGQ